MKNIKFLTQACQIYTVKNSISKAQKLKARAFFKKLSLLTKRGFIKIASFSKETKFFKEISFCRRNYAIKTTSFYTEARLYRKNFGSRYFNRIFSYQL
ncbi:hypothetical protein DMC01_10560 [Campylobacter troglodytis]|nr:hypothetical protein DMC01_10560 [Campylobacter troglodytis]